MRIASTEAAAAGEAFVRSFFDALDRRDVNAMTPLFAADALIVHHDGVRTTVPEFQQVMRSAKRWPVRERSLSQFECRQAGPLLIVGCRNEIRTRSDAGVWLPTEYTETWILEQVGDTVRALRCHYSRVTAGEHREDQMA
ncbi:MAG: nuclear transport factor 2 family protein [Vicinamibacterales bacterium]